MSNGASARPALVLFDFDGTLVDSRAAVTEALNHVRNRKGLPLVEPARVEALLAGGGRGADTTDLLVRPGAGGKERRDALMLYGRVLADSSYGGTTVIEGVPDLLDALDRRGIPTAVISTRLTLFVEEILAHTGLAGRFAHVVGVDTVPRPPPEPDLATYVLDRAGVEPETAWLMADDPLLLEAGRRARVRTVFAAYGYGSPDQAVADLVAAHPRALLEGLGIGG